MKRRYVLQERGLVGLEAQQADGTILGRISELISDEESGEVTHVLVEDGGEQIEVPISALTLDPEADFATFHVDSSDDEPGDHTGDEVGVATESSGLNATLTSEETSEEYAPLVSDVDDTRHEGQLVTQPGDDEEAQSPEDLVREDWEDESYTSADSGYPRTDAYVDPETGEEDVDPAMKDSGTLADDVEDLLDGTGL